MKALFKKAGISLLVTLSMLCSLLPVTPALAQGTEPIDTSFGFRLIKQGEGVDGLLSGAEFTLTAYFADAPTVKANKKLAEDPNRPGTYVVEDNSPLVWSLSQGAMFLTETRAPEGFKQYEQIEFRLVPNPATMSMDCVFAKDYPGVRGEASLSDRLLYISVTDQAEKPETENIVYDVTKEVVGEDGYITGETTQTGEFDFGLYKMSDGSLVEEPKTTDGNSQVVFDSTPKSLLPGDYQVRREMDGKTSDIYGDVVANLSVDSQSKIDYVDGQNLLVPLVPQEFKFTKVGVTDGKPILLEGVEFTLYVDEAATIPLRDRQTGAPYVATSNAMGEVIFENVPSQLSSQFYTIKETKSSLYYTATNEIFRVRAIPGTQIVLLDAYDNNVEGNVVVNQRGKGHVQVFKVDSKDPEKKLAGVEFTLYDKDGKALKTEKTDPTAGQVYFGDLVFGETYTVKETKTIDGYTLSNRSETFTLSTNEPRKIYYQWTNDPVSPDPTPTPGPTPGPTPTPSGGGNNASTGIMDNSTALWAVPLILAVVLAGGAFAVKRKGRKH